MMQFLIEAPNRSIFYVTNLQYQIDQLKDSVKNIQEMIKIEEVVHTLPFTTSTIWRNETGQDLNVSVLCFGAGGGCTASYAPSAGGGGGHMARANVKILKGASVNITVGTSNQSGNGGTTSFGSYCSANGGKCADTVGNGGDGGTGGGGAFISTSYNTYCGKGGSGSYGGGGGGCGGYTDAEDELIVSAAKGGNGGTYGGGGGGGGGVSYKLDNLNRYVTTDPGSGGSAGMYGGAGGNGGAPANQNNSKGSDGTNGISTMGQSSIEFKGPGIAGTGGSGFGRSDTTTSNEEFVLYAGGGGGGGGGYGGNGGNGIDGIRAAYHTSVLDGGIGGSGGGGGGYGAKGGDAKRPLRYTSGTELLPFPCAGGGGGGYGGVGKDASSVAQSHPSGGGGGGYGSQNYGSGRTFVGSPAMDGICIITYVTRELIVG